MGRDCGDADGGMGAISRTQVAGTGNLAGTVASRLMRRMRLNYGD